MAVPSRSFGGQGAVGLVAPDDPAWAAFVARHQGATCFHQPSWLRTLTASYRFRAFVAVQWDANGAISGGLPLIDVRWPFGARRWSCLPFSDECGPLVTDAGDATALLLQTDALRRAAAVADLEIRSDPDVAGVRSRQVAVTHALSLQSTVDGEARSPRVRASVRRHIATAKRMNVRVDAAESIDDMVHAYYGLHLRTRRRQGVPVQPRSYFRALWEQMVEPGQGVVLIARYGSRPVAGAVYLLGGGTVTYKYGASDSEFWSLRPNHAVMAQAIAWATEQGYTTFDFGRTDLNNPGLMRFKESWGAQPRPLRYASFAGRATYRAGGAAQALLARSIPRLPVSVCRGLGELLYRFAA